MATRSRFPIRQITMCAVFTALTAAASQIQIPLPMVPISLALFAVHLTGALLGSKYGAASMTAYALLGAVGAPVFAGFTGGLGILMGSTGGYVLGYILCAFVVGLLGERWGKSFGKLCVAMVAGVLVCYLFGTVWFMLVTKNNLWTSLVYCVFPFLPGDALKILLAAFLTRRLQGPLARSGWSHA